MKRLALFIIGFLLVTPAAHAAVDCAQLEDATPLSTHYVGETIKRADDGIAYAKEAETNADFFSFYLPWWARQIGGSFAQLIDSRTSGASSISDFEGTTSCLRFDQLLLECKIDDVREALDEELKRGSFVSIMRLQSLVLFLQERLQRLNEGAGNNRIHDPTWERAYLFDREPPKQLEKPLCPFHSDYTPPRRSGYGCDATVLREIISRSGDDALPFAEAEVEGQQSLHRAIDRFRTITPLLQSTSPGATTPSPSQQEHKTAFGCKEEKGTCSNSDVACDSNAYCAALGLGICSLSARDTSFGRSLRGPFSYPREHAEILIDFVTKRVQDGLSRTFDATWAANKDLPPAEKEHRSLDDLWISLGRTTTRVDFRSISARQGRSEGLVFATAADSQLEMATSLGTMRQSIGELSRLASTQHGIRAFVGEFAYFLRRTCVFRPCQKSLEQIIRITLEDACFPYTDGNFLKDTVDNPRWKTCAEAACIKVDNLDLPPSCKKILP